MEETFRRLGQRIRELRIERGFKSQEEFADYCNLHRTFIGHLETGRKDFRLSTLIRVAGALGISIAELFTGAENDLAKSRSSSIRGAKREVVLRELSSLEEDIRRVKKYVSGEKVPEQPPKSGSAKRNRKREVT